MTATRSDWFIIINPHAGSGKTMEQWVVAEKKLSGSGVKYKTAFSEYKSHAKELAASAAEEGFRKFVAVGGDGSIHDVFSGVLGWCEETGTPSEDFCLAVIPIGSGNDWIKSLNVPSDTSCVVDLIKKEQFRRQDVVKVVTSDGKSCHMANIGGIGFDSHVCERVNSKKERGYRSKGIYLFSLLHTILHLRKFNATVIGDGETLYSGPCFSIALGNGRFSGGGMLQTSAADMDDGLVDVMIVPVLPLFRIITEIHRIFDGTIMDSKYMLYRQCRELKVVSPDSSPSDIIEIDGEIEGCLPLEVSVTGNKVNVLCGD